MMSPPDRLPNDLTGASISDAMKPTGQGLAFLNRSGFQGQHQKRGLKGIFGVLIMSETVAAHSPNQRAVPFHQFDEGVLTMLPREVFQ
jgi:hypothetical protein